MDLAQSFIKIDKKKRDYEKYHKNINEPNQPVFSG
jgi:hypothetical protein